MIPLGARAVDVDVNHGITILLEIDKAGVRIGRPCDALECFGSLRIGIGEKRRGNPWADKFHRQRVAGGIEVGRIGIACDVVGPRRMDVAGQDNDVLDVFCLDELEQTLARTDIAIPLVGIERKANARRQRRVGNGELRHHHLLTEDVPCGRPRRGVKQLLCEPCLLLLAKELALGIIVTRDAPRNLRKNLLRRALKVHQAKRVEVDEAWDLLVAPRVTRVEHIELDEIAELKAAVDAARRCPEQLWIANRLPLVPSPDRSALANLPIALTEFGIVVLCAVEPRVVGDLVVVPYDSPGVQPVSSLQMGIGAVLCIARSIIVKRQDFFVRRGNAAYARTVAEGSVLVLVNVIAYVDNSVEILLAGDVTIGGEEARGPVRAGCKSEANAIGIVWKRARAADRGSFTVRGELIVVGLAR